MKGDGIRQERETIVNFNEEDEMATIWTASDVVYRRLIKRLGVNCLFEDEERHAIFEVPKGWINLPRRRMTKAATPKQLEARRLFGAKQASRV